jgi:hypothetical protein
MRRETPEGLMDIMALPGMRPERAAKLYEKLGVASMADLEKAAKEAKLAATKGFGAAFERKVLQGLAIVRAGAGARHMHRAAALLEAASGHIRRRHSDIEEVHIDVAHGLVLLSGIGCRVRFGADGPARGRKGRPADLGADQGRALWRAFFFRAGRLLAPPKREDIGGMSGAFPERVLQQDGAVMLFEKFGKGFIGKLLERRHLVFGEKVENVPGFVINVYALAGHS